MKLPQVIRPEKRSHDGQRGPGPVPVFLRRTEVCRRTGLSYSTIIRLRNRGLFPQPYILSPLQELRYLESDINHWILARVERRAAVSSEQQDELKNESAKNKKLLSKKSPDRLFP